MVEMWVPQRAVQKAESTVDSMVVRWVAPQVVNSVEKLELLGAGPLVVLLVSTTVGCLVDLMVDLLVLPMVETTAGN